MHTRGPWTEEMMGALYRGSNGEEHNCLRLEIKGGTREESRGNALIAMTAPELLSALEEIVSISDRKHDAWDRAKAAIAKATGKEGRNV